MSTCHVHSQKWCVRWSLKTQGWWRQTMLCAKLWHCVGQRARCVSGFLAVSFRPTDPQNPPCLLNSFFQQGAYFIASYFKMLAKLLVFVTCSFSHTPCHGSLCALPHRAQAHFCFLFLNFQRPRPPPGFWGALRLVPGCDFLDPLSSLTAACPVSSPPHSTSQVTSIKPLLLTLHLELAFLLRKYRNQTQTTAL